MTRWTCWCCARDRGPADADPARTIGIITMIDQGEKDHK